MKRLYIILLATALVILFLTGCSSNGNIGEAKKVAEDFFKTFYRIDDYTKIRDYSDADSYGMKAAEDIKPYLTDNMYQEFFNTRGTFKPALFANQYQGNISVESVNFTKSDVDKKTGNITLDCNVIIKIKSKDGKEIKSYDKKTTLSLVKDGGKYKIKGGQIGVLVYKED